jgi:hypothetical protein
LVVSVMNAKTLMLFHFSDLDLAFIATLIQISE